MKIDNLLGAALTLLEAFTTNAATHVYDLNTDWSYTANPNGPWSYRQGESLLVADPFPWVGCSSGGCQIGRDTVIEKVTGTV